MRYLLVLLLAGCGGMSTIKPQAPLVQCKQAVSAPTPPAPRADAWVDDSFGMARLSQEAVDWIVEVLALREKDVQLRAIEHACLDGYEKDGQIRQ